MKLLHIIPHIDEEAAGPSYSVPRLCQSLVVAGNEVELSCLAAKKNIKGVNIVIHSEWPFLKRFAVSSSFVKYLRLRADSVDIIHNHSLWSMVNVATGWLAPYKAAKLVTSPRGTLSTWALSQNYIIKKVLWVIQRRVLRYSDMIHATSMVEYEQIRSMGFNAPVAIIPNGIDLPLEFPFKKESDRRTLLFLGRLHPTKCVDRLLHAWKELQYNHPEWDLVIVGKGKSNYIKELTHLKGQLLLERVKFTGAVYGAEKSDIYNNANLFVLPSHSENFGIAVAESLAHSCPVVVSKGAPWSQLEEKKCGWWTDHNIQSLSKSLDISMSTPVEQLRIMGINGRHWMAQDYEWKVIAQKMSGSYNWLVKGGKPPSWIKLS